MTNFKPEDYQAALDKIIYLEKLYEENEDQQKYVGGDCFWDIKDIAKSALTLAAQPKPYHAELEKAEKALFDAMDLVNADFKLGALGLKLVKVMKYLQAARSQLSGQSDGGAAPVSSQVSDRKADAAPPQDCPNFFKSGKIKHNSEINKKDCGCWYDEKSGSGTICSNHAPKSWSMDDTQPSDDRPRCQFCGQTELDKNVLLSRGEESTTSAASCNDDRKTIVRDSLERQQNLNAQPPVDAQELVEALEELVINRRNRDHLTNTKRAELYMIALEKAEAAIEKYKSQSLDKINVELDGWLPIESAPKGEPTESVGCRGSSERFLGLHKSGEIMIIRRLPTMHSYDFSNDCDDYWTANNFIGWQPLPAPPKSQSLGG